LPRGTATGEAVTLVVGAGVVDGCVELDCVELEPHAPTDATTRAAAVINRMVINVCVVVLKMRSLVRAGALALTGPMWGSSTRCGSRIRVADPRVAVRRE
jgi:hypothetical protein